MRKSIYILGLILMSKLVLQLLLRHPVYELQRDEFLHLDLGLHLAWGYISVPPMTSWFSFLIHALGGDIFWIKLVPAIFGTLTIALVWKITEVLGGNIFACMLAALCLLISPLLRINTLFQPNSFDIFFWTLAFYILIRWIQTQQIRWIYLISITFAIGFYSKYNIVFLAAGLVPAILLTSHRNIFTSRHLYLALFLALLLVAPNLIWQYQNDFPTVRQLQELADTQLVHVDRSEFVKDQLIYHINSMFVILAAFGGFIFYNPLRQFRVVGLSYVITIGLFLFFRAKSYYALGLYPVLMAFGAIYVTHLTREGWRKIYLRPAAIALITLLAIPFFMIGLPNKSPEQIKANADMYRTFGMLRWEDGKDHHIPQDFADMLGWGELAQKVDAIYDTIPEPEHTLVLCDNYGQAGAINYYSRHKDINAVSFNADYINWFPLDKTIKHVLLIKESSESESELEETGPLFQTVQHLGSIENPDAREYGTTILWFRHAKVDVNAHVHQELETLK